jgi:hypothetical protein
VLRDRLQRLADEAAALRDARDPGAALLGFVDRLIAEAALKRDLADALASAGTDLSAGLAETGARIRAGIQHLLLRAQASGEIRDDLGTDDLMTIIAAMMFALRRGETRASDPRRAVAVLRDGLLAAPPAVN